jgi:hypothetical protein
MEVWQCFEAGNGVSIGISAIFMNTSQQTFSSAAKTSAAPPGPLIVGFAGATLEQPLQPVICYPPAFVKHHQEAF